MNKKQKRMLIRIGVSAALFAVGLLPPLPVWAKAAVFAAAYLIIGYDVLLKAVRGAGNGRLLDENFLMAVATFGAIAIAIAEKSGNFSEAVAVMLFYQIGEFFQSYAVRKSRKNIAALMDIRPDSANVEQNGALVKVSPDEVAVGTVITVLPGEKVPLDGTVVEGSGTLDVSPLTGESLPREVAVGDAVYSGSVNQSGLLKIQTTKSFGESTVAKILELVENSGARKSQSEAFISRFARVYTPVVCGGALVLAVAPPLLRQFALGLAPDWGDWVYRALTFLVISCPCALVISIPLSFFAGLGGASREGILIKGSNYLEALSKTKTLVFDKTGTLTKGIFEVNGIHHNTIEQAKLLEYAALAESSSGHPIAKSILAAYGREPDRSRLGAMEERSGRGVVAVVDGVTVAAGNERLMEELGVPFTHCHDVGTVVHLALNGQYAGHILISDTEKPHAKEAVAALKAAGVEKTVMLTGDVRAVAEYVGNKLGIDEIHSELLPAEKVDHVESLLSRQAPGAKLAFVGDGINDAPVLARADIGVAMGAMGSDAAIEAADVVLMDDDPLKLAKAVKISRKCLGIVKQNIVFAIGVKVLCLVLGAAGIANMWLAIFADVGVMVLAVLNAIRALRVKKL